MSPYLTGHPRGPLEATTIRKGILFDASSPVRNYLAFVPRNSSKVAISTCDGDF